MKKNKILLGLAIALGFTSVSLSALAINTPKTYYDEKYYTNPSYRDNYYATLDKSLTGNAFRENLYDIISAGYKKHTYKDNSTVLKYTDPDPKHPGNVIGFYSGDSISSGSWNKEHVWAKSHGFPRESTEPYSDAHHLRPTYNQINSNRGNKDFGEVPYEPADEYGNRFDSAHFEPRDEVKGDVARIMFYMATRYGSKTSYNLELVTAESTDRSDYDGKFGNLNTLLKWHYNDPVSREEVYRNNVIDIEFQHNRNPYIDHPEYVDLAYPNEFSNVKVDQAKVDNVIQLINNLPAEIKLTDKEAVNNANSFYIKLNYKEQALVTNYNKLLAALNKIIELEGGELPKPNPDPTPDTPVVPEGDVLIDFSDHKASVTGGYQKNLGVTVGNYSFTCTTGYSAGSELRVGNNKASTLPAKYGLSGDGDAIEANFTIKDITNISVDITSKYGTPEDMVILIEEEGTVGYRTLKKVPFEIGTLNVALDKPTTGKIAIAFTGTKARAVLGKLSITTKDNEAKSPVDSFIATNTKTSLTLEYNENLDILDANIRFGGKIDISAFNSNAEYGVVVLETNSTITAGKQSVNNIVDLKSDNKAVAINPVRVNANGDIDSNGEFLQITRSLVDMEGHYDYIFNAAIYMVYNNELYFAKPTSTSLSKTSKYYIDNNIVTDENIIKMLTKLI